MKKNIYNIYLVFMLLLAVTPCFGQKIYQGEITVTAHDFKVKGDSVYLYMDLNMGILAVDADRSLVLTPVLVGKNKQHELPRIQLDGKRRHAVYLRETSLSNKKKQDASLYVATRLDQLNQHTLTYAYAFKLEDWMLDARLDLKEDLCACAGFTQEVATEQLIKGITVEAKQAYEPSFQVAYCKPASEEVKRRSEEHHAYLDFPVAKTAILPEFGNNPHELNRMVLMIEGIAKDKNVNVTDVEIIGYASPEGGLKQNNALSKGRAESLKNFLITRTNFSAQTYRVKEGGEDWKGLLALVEGSSLQEKEAVLAIINFSAGEVRKQKLRTLTGGQPIKNC